MRALRKRRDELAERQREVGESHHIASGEWAHAMWVHFYLRKKALECGMTQWPLHYAVIPISF